MPRFLLATTLTLAAGLGAQTVVARGELADGRATGCYYCPGYQYVIKFAGTRLESPTVNLAQFVNQQVEFTGTWTGSLLNVTAARVVAESFSITGNGRIGSRYRWNAVAAPGDLAIHALSFGTGFLPLGDVAVQLAPLSTVVLGLGIVNGAGEAKADLDIPNVPALVGVRLNGQALFVPPAAPAWSSNLDSKVVQA